MLLMVSGTLLSFPPRVDLPLRGQIGVAGWQSESSSVELLWRAAGGRLPELRCLTRFCPEPFYFPLQVYLQGVGPGLQGQNTFMSPIESYFLKGFLSVLSCLRTPLLFNYTNLSHLIFLCLTNGSFTTFTKKVYVQIQYM